MAASVEKVTTEQERTVVAKHYNAVPETGRQGRSESRIFYLRNFNNWTKSMQISEALQEVRKSAQDVTVLDMCCGKGGDLLKWKIGAISHLVCADIADVSLEQCRSRYDEMGRRSSSDRRPRPLFSAEIIHADLTKKRLATLYQNPEMHVDLTSCQFSLHYSFVSEDAARCMLRNACESLRVGGYFIGTIPDANQILARVRGQPNKQFSNAVCSVTFGDNVDLDSPPLFGATYDFNLDQVVNCPEFLVHFPLLERLLQDEGMELVYRKPFSAFFDEHSASREGSQLLTRMNALETFPADDGAALAAAADRYGDAQRFVDAKRSTDSNQRRLRIGTLSQDEWEVVNMYMAFAFRKTSHRLPDGDGDSAERAPTSAQSGST